MTTPLYDYRLKFPIANLATALGAMQGLRAAGILSTTGLPENMLGDPRDATGAIVAPDADTAAWAGRAGRAGFTADDGTTIPPIGDPASYYIHIRSEIAPDTLPFDPTSYGLTPSDPVESASVLGVWA